MWPYSDFTISSNFFEFAQPFNACPNDKLSNAGSRVRRSIRRLRGKALGDMIMAVDDHIRTKFIQDAPHLTHASIIPVFT